MKKSITLAAILLALGTSVFAKGAIKGNTDKTDAGISFTPLKSDNGFAVKVEKDAPGKSMVIIYDAAANVVFKDVLTKGTEAEKAYVLSNLDNGDYTVEVASKTQSVKKQIHVYDEGGNKTYFFYQ
jgi:hypothetical protein